jgi:hypothetical protein
MRWLWVWVLAGVQAASWGQAVTGLPAPSASGINGVAIPALATGYLYYNSSTNSFAFQTPSGSGTVNNCASAYAVAYFAATGTAVSCTAAFTGLGYFSTGAAGGGDLRADSNRYRFGCIRRIRRGSGAGRDGKLHQRPVRNRRHNQRAILRPGCLLANQRRAFSITSERIGGRRFERELSQPVGCEDQWRSGAGFG